MPVIANTTSANTFSAVRAQLNSITKRVNQFAVNESTLYANTINANVSLKISGTDVRATFAQNTYVKSVLANTNSFIKSQLANTNSYIATKASWVSVTSTNTALRTLISDRYQVANVNTLLAAKSTWAGLTGTNTALRTLINDRLQVANAVATYQTKAVERAALANTNSRINLINTNLTGTNTALRTLINDRYQVTNVNSNFFKKTGVVAQTVTPLTTFSANVSIQGKLFVTGGIQTYTANNLSLGDNMIYLNSGSVTSNPDLGFAANYNDGTYHHTGFFRDASDAGTWKVFENYSPEPDANVYINTSHATFRLAPFSAQNITVARNLIVAANSTLGNTSVTGFFKLNGTDIRATFAANSYVKSVLANTNSYIATKVNTTTFNSALANTNSYIATRATWTSVTGTNTALRTLISDRLQVANAVATYQTKAVERAALANTNASIATQAIRITLVNTNLLGTNTAIRVLDAQKLSVANATTLLAAKATWAGLTGTNTAIRALVSDRLQVANAVATYLTKNNPVITGTLTANGSTGTSGQYLRTSATGIYWSPVAASGATWAALTSTNTALRTLISDRLQVANAASIYQTKAVERAALANTNSYIAAQATRITLVNTNLTGTNTALRALAATKLAVSNAVATYAPIASPTFTGTVTTSGQRIRISNATDPGIELSNGTTVKGYLFYDVSAADVVTLRHASTATGISINSSGNIGVGTTSPGNRLHVDGTSADNIAFFRNTQSTSGNFGYIAVGAASSISSGALFGQVGSSTTTSQRVMIGNIGDDVAGGVGLTIFRGSGNVGIGTNAPACKLHLAGSGNYAQQIRIQDTSIANRFFDMSMNSTGPYFWAEGAYSIQLYTNSSERMRIESSGAVNLYGGGGGAQLRMYNGGDLVMYPAGNASSATIYCDSGGEIRVSTILTADGSTRAPIHYDSNDTGYYLDPNGSSVLGTIYHNYNTAYFRGGTGVDQCCGDDGAISIGGTGTRPPRIAWHKSGYSEGTIEISQDGWRKMYFYDQQNNGLGVHATGQIASNQNVVAYYSDRRLKEDFEQVTDHWNVINNLTGYRFTWNERAGEIPGFVNNVGKREVGLIAQEVNAVYPEAVYTRQEGPAEDPYKTILHDRFTPVFVEALKDLRREIDLLKEENAKLRELIK